jgi:hypothetical protein
VIQNAKTPAPWNYVGGGVIEDAAGELVAYLAGRLNDPEITDNIGCQIAAAPDLFRVLDDARVTLEEAAKVMAPAFPSLANNIVNQCAIRCADALAKARRER